MQEVKNVNPLQLRLYYQLAVATCKSQDTKIVLVPWGAHFVLITEVHKGYSEFHVYNGFVFQLFKKLEELEIPFDSILWKYAA